MLDYALDHTLNTRRKSMLSDGKTLARLWPRYAKMRQEHVSWQKLTVPRAGLRKEAIFDRDPYPERNRGRRGNVPDITVWLFRNETNRCCPDAEAVDHLHSGVRRSRDKA
jgi:hypothetical protein